MNVERLKALADFLMKELSHRPSRFDLRSWRNWTRGRHMSRQRREDEVTDLDITSNCGTTGCAVGWACAMPEFQAQGLRWKEGKEFSINSTSGCPVYEDEAGFTAVANFFDISLLDAESLFSPSNYRREHCGVVDVVNRINHFARTGRMEA